MSNSTGLYKTSKSRILLSLASSVLLLFFSSVSYCQVGDNLNLQKEYDKLGNQLELARISKNPKELASAYYEIAHFEDNSLYRPEKAFINYLSSRQYYDQVGDKLMVMNLNSILAEKYQNTGLLDEALILYIQVLKWFADKGDLKGQANTLYKISTVYKMKKETDKELDYLQQSIELNKESKDTSLLITYMLDKALAYETLSELDSAVLNITDALLLADEIQNYEYAAKAALSLGRLVKKMGNYSKALKFLKSAHELKSFQPYCKFRSELYAEFTEVHQELENFDSALQFSLKNNLLKDSISNRSKEELLSNLMIRHQSNERKKDIKILEIEREYIQQKAAQQRMAMYVLLIIVVLLLLLFYFIVRFYNQKISASKIINDQKDEINTRKIKELENEKKLISMRSMVAGQETERERISKDLHDSLGGLLSSIKLQFDSLKSKLKSTSYYEEYDRATELLDSAIGEVRSISANLQPASLKALGLVPAIRDMINKYRSENAPEIIFQHYDVPVQIDNLTALTIYRIIQELLNNTIKHAKANEVLIQINGDRGNLLLQYEDDGVGFDKSQIEANGMGLNNINSRIDFIKADVLFDTAPGEGVSVMIKIPLKEKENYRDQKAIVNN
jgi:signal transduction histidine kinase